MDALHPDERENGDRRPRRPAARERGLSLTELLVVLAVMGLLLTVAVFPGARGVAERAREQEAAVHGAGVAQAFSNYLAINLTADPAAVLGGWPDAGTAGAPAGLALPASKDCTAARTLGGAFGWPAAKPYLGCAVAVVSAGGVSRVLVYTWRKGSGHWYENGVRP